MLRAIATCALMMMLAGCAGGPAPDAPPTTPPAPAQTPPEMPGIDTNPAFAGPETPSPEAPPPVRATPAPKPSGPSERETTIDATGYVETRLEVARETTLHWINADREVHSVVSDDGRFAGSGPISQGGDFSATFPTPGEYTFHCRYHYFRGVVVVA